MRAILYITSLGMQKRVSHITLLPRLSSRDGGADHVLDLTSRTSLYVSLDLYMAFHSDLRHQRLS